MVKSHGSGAQNEADDREIPGLGLRSEDRQRRGYFYAPAKTKPMQTGSHAWLGSVMSVLEGPRSERQRGASERHRWMMNETAVSSLRWRWIC